MFGLKFQWGVAPIGKLANKTRRLSQLSGADLDLIPKGNHLKSGYTYQKKDGAAARELVATRRLVRKQQIAEAEPLLEEQDLSGAGFVHQVKQILRVATVWTGVNRVRGSSKKPSIGTKLRLHPGRRRRWVQLEYSCQHLLSPHQTKQTACECDRLLELWAHVHRVQPL